ncbi:uncharacterized protein LOC108670255 [Hyalella azteca]|uniref:Uncharacterized protein LOC108670255 n=1 Tax=Hyalella azteca TaxID=294128 RepID=A0A8B7NHU2_HYAAZ|nr:uncharacterized protein LOC108670255 [Hyalella azteca]
MRIYQLRINTAISFIVFYLLPVYQILSASITSSFATLTKEGSSSSPSGDDANKTLSPDIVEGVAREQCLRIISNLSPNCQCINSVGKESIISEESSLDQSEHQDSALANFTNNWNVQKRILGVEIIYKLLCSCHGDQTLRLRGIADLPPAVQEMEVSDCRGGAVTFAQSVTGIGESHMKAITIQNVLNLTFERGSFDMDMPIMSGDEDEFQMKLTNIGMMKIHRGAIRLSGKRASLEWENVVLSGLPAFSITASNLTALKMIGVHVTGPIETAAVNFESSGTTLELENVDARSVVNSRWVSGDAKDLILSECRLNLAPGAFQQVSFSAPNPRIILRNNVFGDNRWSGQIFPSLSSKVFDFTFSESSAVFNFTNNQAQCNTGNLDFLVEPKKSTLLHWLRCGLLQTLICLEPDTFPVHKSCNFDEIGSDKLPKTTTHSPPVIISEEKTTVTAPNADDQLIPQALRSSDLFENATVINEFIYEPEDLFLPTLTSSSETGTVRIQEKAEEILRPWKRSHLQNFGETIDLSQFEWPDFLRRSNVSSAEYVESTELPSISPENSGADDDSNTSNQEKDIVTSLPLVNKAFSMRKDLKLLALMFSLVTLFLCLQV